MRDTIGAVERELDLAPRHSAFPDFCAEELRAFEEYEPEAAGVADLVDAVWNCDPDDPDERAYLSRVVEQFDRDADDHDGVDRIAELERSIRSLQGEQLKLIADFSDASLRSDRDDPRVDPRVVGIARCLEIGLATSSSTQAAQYKLSLAVSAVVDHPLTLDFLCNGTISLSALRAVVAATKGLDEPDRQQVDRKIAADIAGGMTVPRKLAQAAQRHALRLDAGAAEKRAKQARTDRAVIMKPGPDGTAEVTVRTTAEKAVECMEVLDDAARAMKRAGDPRTVSQLRSDLAVERMTGRMITETPDVELQIVMSARTLFGLDDEPGLLRGFGSIPSALAMALGDSPHTWMRRLVAHPRTQHLAAADPDRRRFGDSLRSFLTWTYQGCTVGTCDSAARHIDHLIDYAKGGKTTLEGGQPLCERHNYDKLHPDISVTRELDGTITWTMPSGRSYETHPPPVLGPGSADPPF